MTRTSSTVNDVARRALEGADHPPAHQLITIAETAKRWHVHPRTVRRRIAEGALTAYRVGPHLIRLDSDEVDAMLRPIPTAGRPGAA